MVIRKENQRLQVRDNVRGGNGTLENRHIIEPDAMFGSATLFTEFFFDPGDSIGVHAHDNDAEVYYMLEGSATIIDDGVETVLNPGDAQFCADGHTHGIYNHTDKDAAFLAIIVKNV